jgi:hypothetical protein
MSFAPLPALAAACQGWYNAGSRMTLLDYSLCAFSSLFVIVNPIAAVGVQFILNALEQIPLFHR